MIRDMMSGGAPVEDTLALWALALRDRSNRCECPNLAVWPIKSQPAVLRLRFASVGMDQASDNAMHQHRHDGGAYRRIELITGTSRRRRWTRAEKATLVAESMRPGVNISDLAVGRRSTAVSCRHGAGRRCARRRSTAGASSRFGFRTGRRCSLAPWQTRP